MSRDFALEDTVDPTLAQDRRAQGEGLALGEAGVSSQSPACPELDAARLLDGEGVRWQLGTDGGSRDVSKRCIHRRFGSVSTSPSSRGVLSRALIMCPALQSAVPRESGEQ